VLGSVALDDADDELLADVAREVEVDVRHRRELAVEEAAEREVVRDRVDVREAGQVADERADRGAAPAPGGRTCRIEPGPRTSSATSRASSSTSQWRRKKPARPSSSMSASSSSSRRRTRRLWPLRPPYAPANALSQTRRSWTIAGSSPSEKSG
jgi:hypothetical protein